MGGKDLEDVLDGARVPGVASTASTPARIGVYGGSYGGFLTLMALFTSPDTFAAGRRAAPGHGLGALQPRLHLEHPQRAAGRPRGVPAQLAHLTSRRACRAPLLILHGMVDDNVHFQDSVRLAQRLIELRKEDWELAVYPVETHAFEEETSWADEYRRILKLFETRVRNR